jgi:DNA-binding XRE family transcriptional regulator
MLKELETYTELPEAAKQVVGALSIVIDRIGKLPKADRDDLFELVQEWRKTADPEERRGVQRAMEEILAQIPVGMKTWPLSEEKPMSRGVKSWALHVGRRIKEIRERVGLNQTQLAEKAGLTQSHISRLEHAEHSATNLTLEKIAAALGVEIGEIDPCSE